MNTKEEFIKLFTLFLESVKAESELEKIGIYIGESTFINSIYGTFDLAVTHLLNEKGIEKLYEEILFTDITVEDAVNMLDGCFL